MNESEAFRQQARDWLEQNCPAEMRSVGGQDDLYWGGSSKSRAMSSAHRAWFEKMRDRGWIAPTWPGIYGGAELSAEQSAIIQQEIKALGCRPPLVGMGLWMLGPVLLGNGTEEQKKRHLPAIARGEVRWCQGYSEPNAGSDLASVRCSADVYKDHLLVNGTKIWTSMADKSDWMFCLLRTRSSADKHDGISFVLVDLASKGITINPIRLIDGSAEFCETVFDNVRVPIENVVGELHQGWRVAKQLLVYERMAMADLEKSFAAEKPQPHVIAETYLDKEGGKLHPAELRQRIARHQMNAMAIELSKRRLEEESSAGLPGASNLMMIMKYVTTEEEKRKLQLTLDIMGSQGLGAGGDAFNDIETQATRNWLFGYGLTIAGGTSEIQLDVISKRVLKLPDRSLV